MSVDLATFKPDNVDDFLKGLLGEAASAAGETWKKMKDAVEDQLTFIAKTSLDTTTRLARHELTVKQADSTLHLLEYNLNSTLLLIEVVPFVIAQSVLQAVFGVINAVVKNYTGIDLNFGK